MCSDLAFDGPEAWPDRTGGSLSRHGGVTQQIATIATFMLVSSIMVAIHPCSVWASSTQKLWGKWYVWRMVNWRGVGDMKTAIYSVL
jgi:hypothetical protein